MSLLKFKLSLKSVLKAGVVDELDDEELDDGDVDEDVEEEAVVAEALTTCCPCRLEWLVW